MIRHGVDSNTMELIKTLDRENRAYKEAIQKIEYFCGDTKNVFNINIVKVIINQLNDKITTNP